MIDALVKFLQSIPANTLSLARVTITATNPITVRLPDGSEIPAQGVDGCTYTVNRDGFALVALGAGAVVWPVYVPPTPVPDPPAADTTTPVAPAPGAGTAVAQPATAAFTATTNALTATVDGSSSSNAAIWAWNYGDGSNATGVTPGAHTYAKTGTYTVVLTVSDGSGATAATSQNVTVAAAAATAPVQPTGSDTVRYQDLPGSTLDKRLDAAPNAKLVSLPVGTITFDDFKADSRFGATTDAAGLAGAGKTASTIKINANSSSKASAVPTSKGTTNPLYLLKFTKSSGVRFSGFTLQGTGQGHLFNGLRVDYSTGPQLSDIRVVHVPGNSDINPGETFAANFWHCTGIRMAGVEIDGDNVGASGIGFNTCHGGFQLTDVTAHDLKFCKGVALWEQAGGGTFTRFQSLNNAFALGFERCDGTYTINQPKFRGSTRADIHLANDGGQWGRAHIVINDPDLVSGQRIKVLLSRTELGNDNKQTRDDLRVYVSGKDRTADLVQFVTSA